MISLSIISMCLSVGCLFATAKKIEYSKQGAMLFLEQRPKLAQLLSLIFLVVSIILLAEKLGTANAIIYGTVLWSIVASLIVLFAPFKQLKTVHLGVLATTAVLVESLYLLS